MEVNVETSPPDEVLPGDVKCMWGMKELMRFLRYGYTRTWELIHHDGLPCYQIGGKTSPLRFDPDEVRAWIAQYKKQDSVVD